MRQKIVCKYEILFSYELHVVHNTRRVVAKVIQLASEKKQKGKKFTSRNQRFSSGRNGEFQSALTIRFQMVDTSIILNRKVYHEK